MGHAPYPVGFSVDACADVELQLLRLSISDAAVGDPEAEGLKAAPPRGVGERVRDATCVGALGAAGQVPIFTDW